MIIFVGSFPETIPGSDKLNNTCNIFNPEGDIIAKFRKVRVIGFSAFFFFFYLSRSYITRAQLLHNVEGLPYQSNAWSRGYNTFFRAQLSLESLDAHKNKNIKKLSFFQAQISLECYFSC